MIGNIRRRPWVAASVMALLTVPFLATAPSHAQGVQSEPLPEVKAPAQKSPKPSKPQDAGIAPQGGGDQALRQRVEQLEEQLVDLQVVIGTLESLARSGVRPAAPSVGSSGPMSGSEEARLDSMETQIRALTAQIEQLSSDVRAGAGRRSEAAGRWVPTPTMVRVVGTLRRAPASSVRRLSRPIRLIRSVASWQLIRCTRMEISRRAHLRLRPTPAG